MKLSVNKSNSLASIIIAQYANIEPVYDESIPSPTLVDNSNATYNGNVAIAKYLGPSLKNLVGSSRIESSQIEDYFQYVLLELSTKDFKAFTASLVSLENSLSFKSFLVGYSETLADFLVFASLKESIIWNGKSFNKDSFVNVQRWFNTILKLENVSKALKYLQAQVLKNKPEDMGSYDIPLPNAVVGKVVTRFPPEPSGYLHIGHIKAACLNSYFARKYKGKLIVRFDDTNPSKEKVEFEESIVKDLATVGIKPDVITHTSDHFEKIYKFAIQLIKDGLAYCDNTPLEEMREKRTAGIASAKRETSVEENLKIFENEMKNGTEIGLTYCLRAKMSVDNVNKCLRDPVIYRCNLIPHHYTGKKYKMYPTYDFACPIVDSIEGVTHALRTNEYRDRNPQYQWFIEKLKIRQVHIWDFSRLNFKYTLLSKRKLQNFVDTGVVESWSDPRFPTVQGILRRGLTVEALNRYILMQGPSIKANLLEWDKIWAVNKQIIDPVAPRYAAVDKESPCIVNVLDGPAAPFSKEILLHKKNPSVGTKNTIFSNRLLIDQRDAKDITPNEEITMMDWGNMIVKDIVKTGDIVTQISVVLHLEGDFKKTKKKLTWISAEAKNVNLTIHEYDYLITKDRLEEDDVLDDYLNKKTEYISQALGDANMANLKKGNIIQIERKGYYIVDAINDNKLDLIFIPDGRAESVALKGENKEAKNEKKTENKEEKKGKENKKSKSAITMYKVKPLYNQDEKIDISKISMYKVKPNCALKVLGLDNDHHHVEEPKKGDKKEKKEKPKGSSKAAPAPVEELPIIQRIDLRVGLIVSVKKHPDADSLYVEEIDLGEEKPRTVVSGLVKYLQPEQLLNKKVVVVCNLKPAAMRGVTSYGMLLVGSSSVDPNKKELLIPAADSKPGDVVFAKGYENVVPDAVINPKKSIFQQIQPEFNVSAEGIARWKECAFSTKSGAVTLATLREGTIS
jgi:glutamyl-tRNA synthetase